MARGQRVDIGDVPYHVLNRSNGRVRIFEDEYDYADFEYLLNEIVETFQMRILAYILMPNHWHLLLYPRKDGDLARSLHWLTTSHVRRHHTRKGTIGNGHLYQGTYKSFLIQNDAHLLTVLKYIERNATRAGLSETAEAWRWGSAYRRLYGDASQKRLLAELPVPLPENYRAWINEAEPAELLKKLRQTFIKEVFYGELDLDNIRK
jgi:REP-associated tyrosine transposase